MYMKPATKRLGARLRRLGASDIRTFFDDMSGILEIHYVYDGDLYLATCPYEWVDFLFFRKGDDDYDRPASPFSR